MRKYLVVIVSGLAFWALGAASATATESASTTTASPSQTQRGQVHMT